MYHNQPNGYAGNEDCGQMSAWYIFKMLGFYPVNPANGLYDVGHSHGQKGCHSLAKRKGFYYSFE